jgi:5-methylcytosine-specific restriction endonuclease McrA
MKTEHGAAGVQRATTRRAGDQDESQRELLLKLKKLIQLEQRTTAEILKSLCLVERDKLYIDLGYSSLFRYLCEELGHSEGEATRRINACRMLKEFPQIEDKVKNGMLNLTNLSRAAQTFKQTELSSEQKLETLFKIESKSTREAEKILFSLSDKRVEDKVKQRRVSNDQISVNLVFNDEEMARLEKLKGRMNRAKNLTTKELIMNLVNIELAKTEKVTTAAARSSKTTRIAKGVLAAQVLKRARYKCEVKDCHETRFLQIHHLKDFAKGGLTEKSNLEVLCYNHHLRQTSLNL